MNVHDAIVKARQEGWEMRLEREHLRKFAEPQIRQRLVETHLGYRYYVKRIEVQIGEDLYYHMATECKVDDTTKLPIIVEVADKVIKHCQAGGQINLVHWKKVEF
jgi:hypothetical protein